MQFWPKNKLKPVVNLHRNNLDSFYFDVSGGIDDIAELLIQAMNTDDKFKSAMLKGVMEFARLKNIDIAGLFGDGRVGAPIASIVLSEFVHDKIIFKSEGEQMEQIQMLQSTMRKHPDFKETIYTATMVCAGQLGDDLIGFVQKIKAKLKTKL